MFHLTTGTYRDLEAAFLHDIAEEKKSNPLANLLVLSPSGQILNRLQRRLAQSHAQLNIHFLTFFALAERVLSEGPAGEGRVVTEPALYREIIHDLLEGKAEVPFLSRDQILRRGSVPRGLPGALAATLKDLQDSGARVVDCANVVREGHLGEAAESAIPILELNVLLYKILHDRDLRTGADRIRRASERVSQSPWIQTQKAIYLYGFYDLTGVQLDLILALANHPHARLYFPYEEGSPAYGYAELLLKDPALTSKRRDQKHVHSEEPTIPKISAFSCSGAHNEVWWTAKQILKQADAGIPYSEMAVTARTLDPYLNTIKEVFETHRIPFALHAEESVGAYPLIKVARQLLRGEEIENTPYTRHPLRLPAGRQGLWLAGDPHMRTIDSRKASTDIESPWSSHVIWARDLITSSLALPKDAEDSEYRLWEGLLAAMNSLNVLDTIGRGVKRGRFLEVLEEKLDGLRLQLKSDNVAGVQVMDVMTARGLTFDTVFVLGLNEKLFPRLIREDPFLSDNARSGLAQALGCRLGRKMDGFQEEKLLFHLATQSATRQLHLSCQRSDEEGKALVVSLYLHDFLKKAGIVMEALPRSWQERLPKADNATLTPKEVSIAFHREHKQPDELYSVLDWDYSVLEHLLRSQVDIESFGALSSHDGIISKGDSQALAILNKGISPQTLKDLAECPFKIFAKKVLELYTEQGDTENGELTHSGRGKLIHKILQVYYQDKHSIDYLERLADAEFKLINNPQSGLYPLAWEAEKIKILSLLRRFIPLDQASQISTGFVPTYFETPLADEVKGIKLQGRVDRLDISPQGFRVVDYKSGSGGIKKGESVENAIMKGKSFQLPVYMALAKTWLESQKNPSAKTGSAVFYRLEEENTVEEPLEIGPDFWKNHGDRFYENLAFLVKNIETGTFYIRPSDSRGYCSWCDYATICRKEHKPTQIRSENSPQRKKHEDAFKGVVRAK